MQAIDCLSAVGRPYTSRDRARMSSLVSPHSMSGDLTPSSRAALMPGRKSPVSSKLAPSAITLIPRRSTSRRIFEKSSFLQK